MIVNSTKMIAWGRGPAVLTVVLLMFSRMSQEQTANASVKAGANAGAKAVQGAAPAKVVVTNLEASCRPEVLEAVAAKLQGITVKNVKDGPKFQDGAKYFSGSGDRPAFCEVSGSFVTDPKTGRTSNFLAVFPEAWNSKYLQIGCSGHCGNFYVSDPQSR